MTAGAEQQKVSAFFRMPSLQMSVVLSSASIVIILVSAKYYNCRVSLFESIIREDMKNQPNYLLALDISTLAEVDILVA